jgi:two-component system C4-dicarboxylate transport sensor histidine kinase DctB
MCNFSHTWISKWGRGEVSGSGYQSIGIKLAIVLVIIAALGVAGAYSAAYRRERGILARDSREVAEQQVAVLKSEYDKQHSAPSILAEDADVISAVTQPAADKRLAISQMLEHLQREIKSADIYVLDKNGTALCASNYALPTSFVGSNYHFRRYYSDAMHYGSGLQFALGTVSRKPGLYISRRIRATHDTVGVVVVKVEFDAIEASWRRPDTVTYVTDQTNDILLSSIPSARFRKIPAPDPSQFITNIPTGIDAWQLSLVTPLKSANDAARTAALVTILAECLIAIGLVWWWRRRHVAEERTAAEKKYREDLELAVESRTAELQQTNDLLSQEITERHQAESRLSVLQEDLVQANKLAQLGQITAGVAHEINQPLAAIRALAENCITMLENKSSKHQSELVGQNLNGIVRLNERIGHITSELRAFSRKGAGPVEPVFFKETLNSALLLNRSRSKRVRLVREIIDPHVKVMGGRIRLEQALVNLLQNAYEAIEDVAHPELRLSATMDDEWVFLKIGDNGPGLAPQVLAQLFTPFVTTKETGLGLGLVIAHDIIRDFGGELTANNGPIGATFTVKLRRVMPSPRR